MPSLPVTRLICQQGSVSAQVIHDSPHTRIVPPGQWKDKRRIIGFSPGERYSAGKTYFIYRHRGITGVWGQTLDLHSQPDDAPDGWWQDGDLVSPVALDWWGSTVYSGGASGLVLWLQPNYQRGKQIQYTIFSNAEMQARMGTWIQLLIEVTWGHHTQPFGRDGAVRIWLSGEDTPRLSVSAVNTQFSQQHWVSLWETLYENPGFPVLSTLDVAATQIGLTPQEALADTPTVWGHDLTDGGASWQDLSAISTETFGFVLPAEFGGGGGGGGGGPPPEPADFEAALLDDFTDSDGTLDGRTVSTGTWATPTHGNSDVVEIISNTIGTASSNWATASIEDLQIGPNLKASIRLSTLPTASDDPAGLLLRLPYSALPWDFGPGSTYYMLAADVFSGSDNDRLQLYRVYQGSFTDLLAGTGSQTGFDWIAGDEFGVDVQEVGGVTQLIGYRKTSGVWTQQCVWEDATPGRPLTGYMLGVQVFGTTVRLDNLGGESLSAPIISSVAPTTSALHLGLGAAEPSVAVPLLANRRVGSAFYSPDLMAITEGYAILEGALGDPNATVQLRMVITAMSGAPNLGGVPTVRQGQSSISGVITSDVQGWVRFSFSPSVVIYPASWYLLELHASGSGVQTYAAPDGGHTYQQADTFSDGATLNYGTPVSSSSVIVCAIASGDHVTGMTVRPGGIRTSAGRTSTTAGGFR